jgi:hypothetical protein
VLFCLAESRLNTIDQFLLLFAEILNRVNMSVYPIKAQKKSFKSTQGDIDGAFFLQIRYIKQIRHYENGTIYIIAKTGFGRRKNQGNFFTATNLATFLIIIL